MNSVVIGSGFGGIAAALRLKAKKHKVTLIEKHPDLGGRARVFRKNGFIYDGGPTVITAPYLINELFELFKKDPKNYIELTPLKIWYQFIFEDKTRFNYSGDEEEMKKQIDWRIYTKNPEKPLIRDLIVEGLSLARTQKEEFASILNSNNNDINILISKLKDFVKN